MAFTKATARRIASAQQREARQQAKRGGSKQKAIIEWYGKALEKSVDKNSMVRLRIAASFLQKQVMHNISRPVLKYKGIRSNRIQVLPESRSKPGEFPKADTTTLLKSIFVHMPKKGKGSREAHVGFPPVATKVKAGTSLDYGLILETQMDRSFLRRTLQEELPRIRRLILKGWKL